MAAAGQIVSRLLVEYEVHAAIAGRGLLRVCPIYYCCLGLDRVGVPRLPIGHLHPVCPCGE